MRTPKNSTPPIVIVAEKDEDERRLLSAILKLKGIKAIPTGTGREIIELITRHHPDLLILDLKLTNKSSAKVIDRVRRRVGLQNLPMVAVSTAKESANHRQMLAGRSTAHLNKPIEFDEFALLIDRFLPERKLHRAMLRD